MNRAYRIEKFKDEVISELEAGNLTTGPWVNRLEEEFGGYSYATYNVAVSSCTMALKIALDAIGIKQGSIVIVPDLTFVATASVVAELGGIPMFADIDPNTLLIDEKSTRELMSKMTVSAIIPVALRGMNVPEWVYTLGIPVIIDSAHEVLPHDTRAVATCYSFHPGKIVPGIDGGMIATNDYQIKEKSQRLRSFGFEPGTRVSRMLGYKGNMTNISAVVVYHSLKILEEERNARRVLLNRYNELLGLNETTLGYYMVLLDDMGWADHKGFVRHYPMPLSEMWGGSPWNRVAKKISEHLVTLPLHGGMKLSDVDLVCDSIKERIIR